MDSRLRGNDGLRIKFDGKRSSRFRPGLAKIALASIIHEGCRSTPLASGTGRIDGGVVRALLNALRVEIMVRGDSHYAAPEVLDLLEEKCCTYILGLGTNRRLAPMA
ncbi:MAG: transposase, partial [Rhodomicrobium sp.]